MRSVGGFFSQGIERPDSWTGRTAVSTNQGLKATSLVFDCRAARTFLETFRLPTDSPFKPCGIDPKSIELYFINTNDWL